MSAARHIGVDVAGTVADVVIADADGIVGSRELATLGDMDFTRLFAATGLGPTDEICHGATVALNGLLGGNPDQERLARTERPGVRMPGLRGRCGVGALLEGFIQLHGARGRLRRLL